MKNKVVCEIIRDNVSRIGPLFSYKEEMDKTIFYDRVKRLCPGCQEIKVISDFNISVSYKDRVENYTTIRG